jgi:hypothetical protein
MIKNNCSTCRHIVEMDTEISPGGVLKITNYKCMNNESKCYLSKMNLVESTISKNSLDSRTLNGCNKYLPVE